MYVCVCNLEVKAIFAVVKQLSSCKESPEKNPVETSEFFFGTFFATTKLFHNCQDHFRFYSLSAVHIYDLYNLHIICVCFVYFILAFPGQELMPRVWYKGSELLLSITIVIFVSKQAALQKEKQRKVLEEREKAGKALTEINGWCANLSPVGTYNT